MESVSGMAPSACGVETTSTSVDKFVAMLFDMLPLAAQQDLKQVAQAQHCAQSHEPQLVAQDSKVIQSLIKLHQVRVRQLNEELDCVESELNESLANLVALKNVDTEEMRNRLTNLSSRTELFRMKAKDYVDYQIPPLRSLASVKALHAEREALLAKMDEARERGKLYDGIENFHISSIQRMVNRAEQEVDNITKSITTHVESRKSLV